VPADDPGAILANSNPFALCAQRFALAQLRLMRTSAKTLLLVLAIAPTAGAQRNNQYGNPEKRPPRPTTAAITEGDLMSRLYAFADDSMEGRNAPLASHARGSAFIVRELQRLKIAPAGLLGSYYQTLPYVSRTLSPRTSLSVNSAPLALGSEFTVTSRSNTRIIDSAQVIFAGISSDPAQMIDPQWAENRFVIVVPPAPSTDAAAGGAGRGGRGGGGAGGGAPATVNVATRYSGAVAIATVVPDVNNPPATGGRGGGRGGAAGGGPTTVLNDLSAARVAAQFYITPAAAAKLLGRPIEGAGPGTIGGLARATIIYDDTDIPHASNVLAIIPGSDPVLKNEYVVLSAHSDHVGLTGPNAQGSTAVDHDSLRTARLALLRMQMQGGELVPNPVGTTVTVNVDSLRRIRPPRRDSIRNGADDDGSGSMALLEIAEAIVAMPVKPKRSTIIAWWTAEEDGLVGSRWWTDNPTVPLNQVVTNINMDMIGRGRAEDIPGGNPDYLGFLGADRLSTALGERVQAINRQQANPLRLDNRFDWPIAWPGYNNIYGRSDHFNFARYNIPIVFFFTGLHADYHQVTDEPQYIDYPHYTRIVNYVKDLAIDVLNLPQRPRVDRNGAIPPRPIKQ
jgi:hypothetical protein